MSTSTLDPVLEHLQEHSHPDVTSEGIRTRATLVEDPRRPDQIVFDVEQHRRAFGARYNKGRPLAAVETYWVRYCYDPATDRLVRLGINLGEHQTSTRTIHSFPRLAKDWFDAFQGLVDRAWP